jgi:hypothetical protein
MYGLDDVDFKMIDHHVRNGIPMHPTLEQEAHSAIRLAKLGTGAIIGLQAIAALAAFGMLLIQWNTYNENHKKTRSKRRRSR